MEQRYALNDLQSISNLTNDFSLFKVVKVDNGLQIKCKTNTLSETKTAIKEARLFKKSINNFQQQVQTDLNMVREQHKIDKRRLTPMSLVCSWTGGILTKFKKIDATIDRRNMRVNQAETEAHFTYVIRVCQGIKSGADQAIIALEKELV
jgi:hypothetical protein